jgi:hypothetical protein
MNVFQRPEKATVGLLPRSEVLGAMIICLGPVCIPLWGLLPVLTVWLVQAWAVLKRWCVCRRASILRRVFMGARHWR